MTITTDGDVLGGEPRIEGSRTGVRHVAGLVVDSGRSPAHVADQLDISLAAVYEAVAYYYDNIEEMRALDRENAAAFERVRESSLKPKEPVSCEAGPYRLVGEVDPRQYFNNAEYPTTTARIEIGFQLRTKGAYEYYWINWIEPDRSLLVGWHQDDTHDDLGPVHLQVNDGSTAVAHRPAEFIDSHPFAVLARRFASLQDAVSAVDWENGRPVGFGTSWSDGE